MMNLQTVENVMQNPRVTVGWGKRQFKPNPRDSAIPDGEESKTTPNDPNNIGADAKTCGLSYKPIWPVIVQRGEGHIAERFWAKVARAGADECWRWTDAENARGYGRFKIVSHCSATAHRVAWALANRSDPGAFLVRHKCDNPACCNPQHLELGTHADNSNDKMVRGRWRGGDQAGVNNPRALLAAEHVAEIVRCFNEGLNNKQIADRVPIGHSMVSKIRVGLMWRRETAALGYEPRPQFTRRAA
jgi:hypothetical protein